MKQGLSCEVDRVQWTREPIGFLTTHMIAVRDGCDLVVPMARMYGEGQGLSIDIEFPRWPNYFDP